MRARFSSETLPRLWITRSTVATDTDVYKRQAYMRGRTLNDAFIILDEAQNTTSEQMKMFLTRMGMGSKMVITGDVTQIDLPTGKKSGLIEALEVLKGVNDIGIVTLSHRDVVRHEDVYKRQAFPTTDHTREYVPLLVWGLGLQEGVSLGTRSTFADVSATVLEALGAKARLDGTSFYDKIALD